MAQILKDAELTLEPQLLDFSVSRNRRLVLYTHFEMAEYPQLQVWMMLGARGGTQGGRNPKRTNPTVTARV